MINKKEKEKMKNRGIRFSKKQWEQLQKIANENKNITASDVVRHAVDKFLEQEK